MTPGLPGLGRLGLRPVVGIDCAADADAHRLGVDIRPPERQRLAAPHPCVGDQPPQREQLIVQLVAVPGEEQGELIGCPGRNLGLFAPVPRSWSGLSRCASSSPGSPSGAHHLSRHRGSRRVRHAPCEPSWPTEVCPCRIRPCGRGLGGSW